MKRRQKMKHHTLNYYAGGNTARGFYSLFESNLIGLERIFILKGGPGTGKSHMMKKIANKWGSRGFNLELIHCASDNSSLDGVIIPQLKFGIVDGTAPHVIEPKAPGAIEEYVNLGEAWDSTQLAERRTDILHYQEKIKCAYQNAYDAFASGLTVHDELEKIFISEMDIEKANQVTDALLKDLFTNVKGTSQQSTIRRRFLGATTPQGPVDFLPNITEGLEKRYFLKGRAGTGKSTILKKVANRAESHGFDIEIYHCGLDPESLDMVLVRELGWAIFDSTAPHEYFPEKQGDEVIDMYEKTITPGTDEKYADKIEAVANKYRALEKEGVVNLGKAKSLHDELEHIYIDAINFAVIDNMYEKIEEEIERLAKS